MADEATPDLQPLKPGPSFDYRGCPVPWWFHTRTADFIHNMELGDDDIILVSQAKAGSHWVNSIVRKLIEVAAGELSQDLKPFYLAEMFPVDKSQTPCIMTRGVTFQEFLAEQPGRKIFSTHSLPHCLPKSLQQRGRVIYVVRNPKDILVSLYYFNGVPKDGWSGCLRR